MAELLFRDTEGYKARLARFNTALESYYTDIVEVNDFRNLEELMLSSYELAQHSRDASGYKHWSPKHFSLNVGNAITDATDVISNKAGRFSIAYEVSKLEGLSRSIYEHLKKKRGIGKVIKRTM